MPYEIHTAKATIIDASGQKNRIDVFASDVEKAVVDINQAKDNALNAIGQDNASGLRKTAATELNNIVSSWASKVSATAVIDPDLADMMVENFDYTKSYKAGDCVRYEDSSTNPTHTKLYKFIGDYAANSGWNNASKIEVKIGEEIDNLNNIVGIKKFIITPSEIKKGYNSTTNGKTLTSGTNASYRTIDPIDISILIPGSKVQIKASLYNGMGAMILDDENQILDYIIGNNAEIKGYSSTQSAQLITMEVPVGAKYIVSTIVQYNNNPDASSFAVTCIPKDNIKALADIIAENFDETKTYVKNTYVRKMITFENENNTITVVKLFRLTANYEANSGWDNASKVEIKIGEEITDLKNIADIKRSTISTTESTPRVGIWAPNSAGILTFKSNQNRGRTLENPLDISSLSPGTKVSVLSSINGLLGVFITNSDKKVIEWVDANNAVEKGYQTNTYDLQFITLTVPQNAKYMVSNIWDTKYAGMSDFDITVYHDALIGLDTRLNSNISDVEARLNSNISDVEARATEANNRVSEDIDAIGIALNKSDECIYPNLEVGGLGITTDSETPWTYTNSSQFVRTKSGYTVHLLVGDKIGLTSYENGQRFSIGWRYNGGTYSRALVLTSEYTVTAEGDYVIVIYQEPKIKYSSPYDLGKLLYIKRANYMKNPYKRLDKYLIKGIAHRGYTYEGAPENTIHSFRAAKAKGFHYVETDLAFTSDRVAVLLHDEYIDRVACYSSGAAAPHDRINEILYDDVYNTYDFGIYDNNVNNRRPGTKIMTLEELLIFCRANDMYPYIEIKSKVGFSAENFAPVVDMINKYGMMDSCTFISFGHGNLLIVSKLAPTAKLGLILGDNDDHTTMFTDKTKADLLNLKTGHNTVMFDPYAVIFERCKADILQFCQQNDMPLCIAMTDDLQYMRDVDNYVTECCSNRYNFAEVIADREMGIT